MSAFTPAVPRKGSAVLQARGILTSRLASRTHERDACSEKHRVGQAERGKKRMQRRCVPKVPSPVRRALGESACSATPLSRTHSDLVSSCFNSQTAMATMMNSRSSLTAKLPQKISRPNITYRRSGSYMTVHVSLIKSEI